MSQIQRKYLHQQTRPASDFGFEGQRRLQDTFSEPALLLRYDLQKKNCQVWFMDNRDCYLIYAVPAPFHASKAIHEVREREKGQRRLKEEYERQIAEGEKDARRNRRAMAEEIGGAYRNVMRNRVMVQR